MAEDWASYFCRVNDKLASIFVNLALRVEAPILSKPSLLWIWVDFQSPRADGLSASSEAPILFQIEDALNLQVPSACNAIAPGRITTDGRREFYFYAETTLGFDVAVAKALSNFPQYKFDFGHKEDLLWEHYLDVLYPGPEDMQRIKNRNVLDVLESRGDVHTIPRDVRHWIYFPSVALRKGFSSAAQEKGFTIAEERTDQAPLPHGIILVRKQSVEETEINESVIELFLLAQQFQGDYDGWETQVITQ